MTDILSNLASNIGASEESRTLDRRFTNPFNWLSLRLFYHKCLSILDLNSLIETCYGLDFRLDKNGIREVRGFPDSLADMLTPHQGGAYV